MNYSIILPTLNRAVLVRNFLACIEKQTILPYEIIIIDQSDDYATRYAIDAWNPPGIIKRYLHRKVKSLILARNAGLDACEKTDLVAFFDDDVTVDSRFCEEIIKVFYEDKNGLYAGGMGTVHGWTYRPKPFQSFFLMPHEGSGRFLPSGAQTFPHWKKSLSDTEFLSGGCTFWRRKIIQAYRFDERLSGVGYGDDADISYRISRDYKLFFQPKSVCYQVANPPGKYNRRKYRKVWIQNMYYLAQKNNFFLPAYFWCILGYVLRDLACFDFAGVIGDFEGIKNIILDRIDTVEEYYNFKRRLKINKTSSKLFKEDTL